MIDRSHVGTSSAAVSREPVMPTHISIALQAVLERVLPRREEPEQPIRRLPQRTRRSRRRVVCAVD